MNPLQLFLPCAAGIEGYLLQEVLRITGCPATAAAVRRGGVDVLASWHDVMRLNLYCRLAQRVLVLLSRTAYRHEQDLYHAASDVAWEAWFTPRQSIKVEVTAQHCPLSSLNFAALKIKDAVCDRFRARAGGVRPDVDTHQPDVRIHTHLGTDTCLLYLDTSGQPLFKRGWRRDCGDAPLKETLAAAMLAVAGWTDDINGKNGADPMPLYDPCCGSGTIAIEAAQMACRIAPGSRRRFAFEHYLTFQPDVWNAIRQEAADTERPIVDGQKPWIFGSDVSHRMVDFAQRNAVQAGVAGAIEFRGGDALQRMSPCDRPGLMLLNPPYGQRIDIAGISPGRQRPGGDVQEGSDEDDRNQGRYGARELPQTDNGGEFFGQLATHWKRNYPGWTAWILSPDLGLPARMHLKPSRKVPMWNGPIECRLFCFEMVAGRMASRKSG